MFFMKNVKKRSMSASNSYIFKLGQPTWSDWTVEKSVKDGYKASGWVFRAISLIARNAASVPWMVFDKDGEAQPDHPLSKMFANPNPHFSRQDIFELLFAWLELSGNGYVHKVMVGNSTKELWPVSPDRIAPIPSKDQGVLLKGFSTERGSKKLSTEYTIENMVHFKLLDPSNPITGISPLMASARSVDTDVEQQNWNKSAMENRGVMDGVFTFNDPLTDVQYSSILEKIKERFSGAKNARIPAVVGANAKYTRMSITPAEMDFIESRKFNREEIFIIFGVPPQLAGAMDMATYNNYATSKRIFWESTLIPLLDDVADTFNMSFNDELGEGYRIGYDTKDIVALRENEDEKAATAKIYFDMGVPVSAINEKMSLGIPEYDNWDIPYGGFKPTLTNQVSSDDDDNNRAHEVGRSWFLVPTEKRNFEEEQEERDKQAEGWVKDTYAKLLEDQQAKVFLALDDGDKALGVIAADSENWIEQTTKVYLDVAYSFAGSVVVNERGERPTLETRVNDDPILTDEIQEYLDAEGIVLEEVAMIQSTTSQAVIEQVRDALLNGSTITELQQAIIDTGVYSESRALMLARTIAGTAASIGQLAGAESAGAKKKVWMDSAFNVRDIHVARNGETVDMDARFSDQGYGAPRYPLDPDIGPADRVNCRCSMTFK